MKEEIKDKTWYEEVKEDFVKNISDTYTLNLAISILEDRKELLDKNLDLQSQLKAKEEVIKEAIDKLYCWGEVLNAEFQQQMLEILSKGENK